MKRDRASLLMILTSCVYLLLGMTYGLIIALKMIWPSIGDFELLTFGRSRVVHTNVVLFGWLLQADLGLILWILPRLLKTKLFSQKLAYVTWGLFNIAALGGVAMIMMGHGKAIEYAEIPFPFDALITLTWVTFAINVFGTLAKRKSKFMYVAVWYAVGAVIWTTFVYITGNFITVLPGVSGMNQANLTWFYVHNAVGLVFTPLGISIAYYMIPKQLNTPLYSHKLSLVGFWVISFVYCWTGAHHMIHGPISYWLETVAILFSFSLIIPVVAVVTNFYGTYNAAPKGTKMKGAIAKYFYAGTTFYLLTCLQGPFHSMRSVSTIVSKTDWIIGHAHMAVVGAFSFFAFGGIYYVLPRIMGRKLYSQKLADWHFWLTFLAAIPFFAILWVRGVLLGFKWLQLDVTFVDSLRLMKPYHIIRMLTGAIIIGAQFIFIYNIWETMFGAKSPEEESSPGKEPTTEDAAVPIAEGAE